ncbi:MAG: ATP-binding protein, partial [Acidobacteriota bacterium]|nr:ATP-binding protein [Acidobacteriota bacterium]
MAQETGPVGVSRKVKVWKAARTHAAVSLLKLNRIDFEEGWHHVRVLPWTVDGDPIPIEEPAEPTGRRANESEPFYVLPDASIEEEPPQRAVPKALSVEHARLDRQFVAMMQGREPTEVVPRSIGWTRHGVSARTAVQVPIEARFGADGTLQIPVARWLERVERRILEAPERPASWRMQLRTGQPYMPTSDVEVRAESAAMHSFIDARSTYFRCIAQDSGLVSQGLDVLGSGPAIVAYTAAYLDLLKDLSAGVRREAGAGQLDAIRMLRSALSVDTVRLAVED